MTIAEKTTSTRNDYIGNGSTTNFSFTFDVLNEANSLTGKNYSLKVILTTSGVEVEQVEDTDYTVTYDSATRLGSVTFATAPASSVVITLLSAVSKTQSTDYINIGTDKFPADSHEKTVDKLTLITRELQEAIDRAILLSESSTLSGVTLPVSAVNANKAVVVNSAGNNLTAASLIDIDTYPITTFAESILDDETALEVRGTLGLDTDDSVEFDTLTLGSAIVAGGAIKDEDTMSSDSATALATQQSIKAYVDAKSANSMIAVSLSADQTITNATSTKIAFDVETLDTNSDFDSTTNYRFTPTVAGKYYFSLTAQYVEMTNGARAIADIIKNGSTTVGRSTDNPGNNALTTAVSTALVDMNGSTDYIEFFTEHTGGGNEDLDGGGISLCRAEGFRVID